MLTENISIQRKWHRRAQLVILGFVVAIFSSCSKSESADMSFLALLGGGAGEGAAPTVVYPASSYSLVKDTAASPLVPTVTGSPLANCIASPALPSGLNIDAGTCTIAGTPTALQGATSYTITATNSNGSGVASIEIAVDPDPSCTLGQGGRIDVGNSDSFLNRVIDPDTSETIECSFTAQFNDGSEKVIFLTADGNGETTVQKDSCGNEWTVTATEQDKFLTAEMSDQFFENISATDSPAANQIIPGDGETNEPTNATHVSNVRSFVCQYD